MTIQYKQLVYGLMLLLIVACTPNSPTTSDEASELIVITQQQFELNAMQLGEPSTVGFDSIVACNGSVVPLPDGLVALTVPVSGVVKSIKVQNGQAVHKGQVLFEIGGNEILDLQRDFIQATASYERLKSEYERTGHLFENKALPEKEYQLIKNEYLSARSAYLTLKLKIEGAGLPSEELLSGRMSTVYAVRAPISGTVGQLKAVAGAYVDNNSLLAEVINPDRLQLQVSVFDADASKVRKGQRVRFHTADGKNSAEATINNVAKELADPARVLFCYAPLSGSAASRFFVNQTLVSEIVVATDSVKAIPTVALIKGEDQTFVLLLKQKQDDRYEFEKVAVEVGRQYNGLTELKEELPQGHYAVKGVYNLVL